MINNIENNSSYQDYSSNAAGPNESSFLSSMEGFSQITPDNLQTWATTSPNTPSYYMNMEAESIYKKINLLTSGSVIINANLQDTNNMITLLKNAYTVITSILSSCSDTDVPLTLFAGLLSTLGQQGQAFIGKYMDSPPASFSPPILPLSSCGDTLTGPFKVNPDLYQYRHSTEPIEGAAFSSALQEPMLVAGGNMLFVSDTANMLTILNDSLIDLAKYQQSEINDTTTYNYCIPPGETQGSYEPPMDAIMTALNQVINGL